jgi:hypothetical protein
MPYSIASVPLEGRENEMSEFEFSAPVFVLILFISLTSNTLSMLWTRN